MDTDRVATIPCSDCKGYGADDNNGGLCPTCGGMGVLANLTKRKTYLHVDWQWQKWTFGVWRDVKNRQAFGIDIGPLEIVWRYHDYT